MLTKYLSIVMILSVCINANANNINLKYNQNRWFSIVEPEKKFSKSYHFKVNSVEHNAGILDIVTNNDGTKVITTSQDHSIKIWDAKTGNIIRTIHTYDKGGGNVNYMASVAISKDNRFIAVSGGLGYYQAGSFKSINLKVYSLSTGKLIKSYITNHTGMITSLDYSEDSKYLISASTNGEIFIWDTSRDVLKETITTGFDGFAKIEFYNKFEEEILLVKQGNYIFTYDLNKKKIIESIHEKEGRVNHVYFNGTNYVIIKNKSIVVLDSKFQQSKVIKSDSKTFQKYINGSFSKNKRYFAVALLEEKGKVNIYDSENNFELVATRSIGRGPRVSFIDNHQIVVSNSFTHGIEVWNFKNNQLIANSDSKARTIMHVGLKNNEVYFSTLSPTRKEDWYKQDVGSFNLNTNKISTLHEIKKRNINYAKYENEKYILDKMSLIQMGRFKRSNVSLLNKESQEITNIPSNKTNTRYISAFLYNNYVLLPTTLGDIDIYDTKGKILRTFEGHTASLSTHPVLHDNILLTAGHDKTLALWDLNKLDEGIFFRVENILEGSPAKKAGFKVGDIILSVDNKKIKNLDFFPEKQYKHNSEHIFKVRRNDQIINLKVKDVNGAFEFKLSYLNAIIKPMLNIFISIDNEWVMWTPEGFFDASKNGAKYIDYHINQGPYKEAEFVTIDALYSTFYRPDLIQKALVRESLAEYAKNINIDKLLQDGLAPEVHILTKTEKTKEQDLDLKVQVCPKNNGGYDNLTLLINDTPVSVIDTSRALKFKKKSKRNDCFIYDQTISLAGGVNNIGFKATNKAGNIESKPDFLNVTFDDTNLKKKLKSQLAKMSGDQNINDLHILAIAVNEYADEDLKLNYSINDASEMLNTIKDVAKPLFNKIHTYKLFDKDVTKQQIENMFNKVKSTREDVFLLYIAGHGITDEYNGNYYYIPYDFINKDDEKAVQSQGVGQKDLMLGLSKITALKSLVLLDTCNSGSFVEADMQKTTTNRLARATGRATISASSKSQVALEGYEGHGVFTYTLLEALKGKGYKDDKKITINELNDYVEDTLPDRTNKKWGYRQIPQSSMYGTDFNIGSVE